MKKKEPTYPQIFAIDSKGNREEIDNFYWFEENMVHDWGGDGMGDRYHFEIYVEGEKVYPKPEIIHRKDKGK